MSRWTAICILLHLNNKTLHCANAQRTAWLWAVRCSFFFLSSSPWILALKLHRQAEAAPVFIWPKIVPTFLAYWLGQRMSSWEPQVCAPGPINVHLFRKETERHKLKNYHWMISHYQIGGKVICAVEKNGGEFECVSNSGESPIAIAIVYLGLDFCSLKKKMWKFLGLSQRKVGIYIYFFLNPRFSGDMKSLLAAINRTEHRSIC